VTSHFPSAWPHVLHLDDRSRRREPAVHAARDVHDVFSRCQARTSAVARRSIDCSSARWSHHADELERRRLDASVERLVNGEHQVAGDQMQQLVDHGRVNELRRDRDVDVPRQSVEVGGVDDPRRDRQWCIPAPVVNAWPRRLLSPSELRVVISHLPPLR